MIYNSGDKITLGNLGEYIVFDSCIYNDKEFMALMKKDQTGMIMVEVKTEDDLEIIDEKDEIKKIIKFMAS